MCSMRWLAALVLPEDVGFVPWLASATFLPGAPGAAAPSATSNPAHASSLLQWCGSRSIPFIYAAVV